MIAGIDADTRRIAWAVIRDGAIETGTILRAGATGAVLPGFDAALDALFAGFAQTPCAVALEGIFLAASRDAANVRGFSALAEVQGEVKRAARTHGVRLVCVPPIVWQSRILGVTRNRDAIKAAARAVAEQHAGRIIQSQHESDAACIALWLAQDPQFRALAGRSGENAARAG